MAKKILSIVIGPECTKVCEVSYKKNNQNKGIRVYRSVSFPTPENTIEDGYIKDTEAFGEELRRQLKLNKFKADKAVFAITSSKIANREIILPPTKDKKIMEIIKTGATDYFPIDIKDYIISYSMLEKRVSDRMEKALQKKLDKKENKLAKHQSKLAKKSGKKKSQTELIAEKMDLMEHQAAEKTESGQQGETSYNVMSEKKKHMRVSVYAVPSSLVKNYYQFAKAVHLDIVALDYIGNSNYQIIKRQVNRGTNVFVQLNEQDTLISILRDDTLILQRTIGYGISTLTEAMLEQEFYQVHSKEEALELLSNRNLLTGEVQSDSKKASSHREGAAAEAALSEAAVAVEQTEAAEEYNKELYQKAEEIDNTQSHQMQSELSARANILESLHFLTNSIARMLDYYKSTHKNEEIRKIYLSGTGMRIQGIDLLFFNEIGKPHAKMDRLWTVSAAKKAGSYRRNPGEFISCIGAVVKPIDFVPKELLEKKQKRSAIFATIFFTMACIAGSAGTVYIGYSDYQSALVELDQANNQLAAMPQVNDVYTEYDNSLAELSNLQQLEQSQSSNNDHINAVIEELEKKLPSGTSINTMQFTESGISMSVVADDHNAGANALIAKVYQQLEAISYFETVDIDGISMSQDEVSTKVSFTITCTYPSESTALPAE